MTERAEFGGGECVVTPATASDVAELNADMRDADREEVGVFGLTYDDCKSADGAWAVRIGGDLVCVCGTCALEAEESVLCRRRQFFLLSTNKVWRHKVGYVRYSRPVAEFVLRRLPAWVDTVWSTPMAKYTASIEWQKRCLGFTPVGEGFYNGVRHIVLERRKGKR